MIGYDLIRALASFLYDSFWYYLFVCWLYTQIGCKMTVVILGFIFPHTIQRKGIFISSDGSLKSEETSFLKTPANLLSYLHVPSESQAFFLTHQGVSRTAWLWLGSQCRQDEITVAQDGRSYCSNCQLPNLGSLIQQKFISGSLHVGVGQQGELHQYGHSGTQADGGFILKNDLAITAAGRKGPGKSYTGF